MSWLSKGEFQCNYWTSCLPARLNKQWLDAKVSNLFTLQLKCLWPTFELIMSAGIRLQDSLKDTSLSSGYFICNKQQLSHEFEEVMFILCLSMV